MINNFICSIPLNGLHLKNKRKFPSHFSAKTYFKIGARSGIFFIFYLYEEEMGIFWHFFCLLK